ncbi:hypothetical protein [Rhodococcus sp. A14]|uniref:hypothetical protein n=1 Tax=Rhodococcus sp. A14 TaxID=1194106 RepID=UPI001420B6BE|nr:hypothetical protein [Rhodococcus sp. A14]
MSRFLRLAVVASTAAAALSLTAAHAHAAPAPSGCDIQFFAVGAMSTCAPGSVNTHQLELVCVPFTNLNYPVNTITVWGPEVPTFLPSIALCPPPIYFALVPLRDTQVHTR